MASVNEHADQRAAKIQRDRENTQEAPDNVQPMSTLSETTETLQRSSPKIRGSSEPFGQITGGICTLDHLALNAVKSVVMELAGVETLHSEVIKPAARLVCLVGDTLISTPSGSVPIDRIQPGDIVCSGRGTPVEVIGAVKTFTTTTLYGFEGFGRARTPFFTGAHPFLSPSGEILVADKLSFLHSNPHMRMSKRIAQMPKCDIEILRLDDGKVQSVVVPRMTSADSAENEPIYFLVVNGDDGSYVANGFVTLAEVPDFSSWSGTLQTVMSTAALLKDENGRFDVRAFKNVQKLAEDIKGDWEGLIKDEGITGSQPEGDEEGETKLDMNAVGEIMRNHFAANLALSLYSSCGLKLFQYVDERGMEPGPFFKAAEARIACFRKRCNSAEV